MLLRTLYFLTLCPLSVITLWAANWKPAQEVEAYENVIKIVRASESYHHFFAQEKAAIPNPSPEYYQARWQYFRQLHIKNPKVQSTGGQAQKFVQLCLKKGWLKGKPSGFKNAAQCAGMELITDRNPMEVPLKGIRVHRDLAYADYQGYQPKLDLFLPEKTDGAPLPCIIFIHGGGWVVHKRAWFEGHARIAAREGFAAVTIDYRLLPAVSPLECTQDAKAAVRWLRKNAKKYGIDPQKIGACGASAGAHLAAILATSHGEKNLEGAGGNPAMSSQIQAAVGFATPALTGRKTWPISRHKSGQPLPKWFKLVSPYQYAGKGDAPMLLIHGSKDRLVSPREAHDLAVKLKAASVPCEVQVIDGQGHVFYMEERITMKALKFFKKHLEGASG